MIGKKQSMLDKDEYLKKIVFLEFQEIKKVKYLSFYKYLNSGKNSFLFSEITEWFEKLNLSAPNISRLKAKIRTSRDFITKKNSNSFSLHAKAIEQLKSEIDKIFPAKRKTKISSPHYVNLERLENLKRIKNLKYDLTRFVRMCEEINSSYDENNFLSVCMLLRAMLDHIPPIFECNTFTEIANNYAGSKSFKENMKRLSESSRKIADMYLHVQIRSKETLPNNTQIDFSNELDVLIAEIIRIL